MILKIKDGFILKQHNGQNTIVCTRKSSVDFNSTITLNRTTAFLFKKLSEGEKTKEELLNLLLENFNISTVLALNDIDVFVRILKENEIVEE